MRPELLAPAGHWEALKAAVANGADAVYFGLQEFNARHRAANFTAEELPRAVRFLHDHNVRGYVACNTLVFPDEIEEFANCIAAVARSGADAVIVQDLGMVRLIRRLAPALPIHASTQMTLTEARGVEFVRGLGVERAILARELSLEEIAEITNRTDLPVEVFVHGALCVAYSGQCLTSEALGGRSANRGQCAQACRLPYELIVDQQPHDLQRLFPLSDGPPPPTPYLLSPRDLAAPDLVPDLVRLGVACFKIEGRLKGPEYVAAATQAYRAAIDAALENRPFQPPAAQTIALQQTFSRGFSHGFLDGVNHQTLVQGRFPKSRGLRLGTVVASDRYGLIVRLDGAPGSTVAPGDGVVFDQGRPDLPEQGGRVIGVETVSWTTNAAPAVRLRFSSGAVDPRAVASGSLVWKTDDPALNRRLAQTWARIAPARRETVHVEVRGGPGLPLRTLWTTEGGARAEVESPAPLPAAHRQPLTRERLHEQFAHLVDTPFRLGTIELRCEGEAEAVLPSQPRAETCLALPVFASRSLLNALRRAAVSQLLAQRARRMAAADVRPSALPSLRSDLADWAAGQAAPAAQQPGLTVLVRTDWQLEAVLNWTADAGSAPLRRVVCDFEDPRRYEAALERCRKSDLPCALATLRVIKPREEGWLRRIAELRPEFLLVRNLASLCYFRERFPEARLLGDAALNVANEFTAWTLIEAGCERLVPSFDLNGHQLESLLHRFPSAWFEVVVHQRMPMFHMEHCVFAHTLSQGKDHRDCGRPCERHVVDLRDRVGQQHPLIPDVGCRNTLFNANPQSAAEYVPRLISLGVREFRVELLRESADETVRLLDAYAKLLRGEQTGRATWQQLRVVNHLGVTRGPLDFE